MGILGGRCRPPKGCGGYLLFVVLVAFISSIFAIFSIHGGTRVPLLGGTRCGTFLSR